ncbi:retrovirus-related Pol polyprotein from transposon TNT 1-94 [Trichonephila clavipes]|nr:retrovirus-related Pol polyprotein from transposon TNT 1-94 [Trichonephila clavipes]
MHYGCWQFIIQTKPEQPDEEATYKEKLDLQLRKDRCYTLIYTNISSDLKNLITETTDGVAAWKILKDHFEPVTKARRQPDYKKRVINGLDDLYIGFQLIRWLPQEFQSTVQQIYRWKEEDFRVVKIEAELILEANRLQLMKQDLEKAENAYLSSFTSKKSKTLSGATAAAHGHPNGKNDYQKKGEFNINLRFCEAECSLLELDKQPVTSCILFEENSDKGVWVIDTAATSHFCNDKSLFLDLKPITNMKMSFSTEDKSCPVEGIGTLRFRPDHYIIPKSKEISFFSDVTAKTKNGSIEIWHQRFCHVNNDYLVKTSKNDSVKGLPRLTDNGKTHCIPCKLAKSKRVSFKKTGAVRSKRPLELLHMDLCGPMPTESQGGNKYFLSIIDDYSRRKDNTESQGFSDLSEQQEALMVEVTIPNCYKQVIRSRDASKWHNAMDKVINVKYIIVECLRFMSENGRKIMSLNFTLDVIDRFIERHGTVNEKNGRSGILPSSLRLTEKNVLEVISPTDTKI